MDATKLMELTAEIVEISGKLNALRAQRDSLTPQILPLEAQLMTLMVEHQKMFSAIAGVALPAPVVAAPAPTGTVIEAPGVESHSVGSGSNAPLKNRVLAYLQKRQGDEPISAIDVADVLKIDASIVREAMLELRNAR